MSYSNKSTEIQIKALASVRYLCSQNRFECFCEDKKESYLIEKAIQAAEPNKAENDFPDFLIDDYGFIEHFEVSSSLNTRKGYQYKKNSASIIKNVEEEKQKYKNDESYSITYEIPHLGDSHENLIKSFETKWDKHIQSMEKCKTEYDMRIFLIDYVGEDLIYGEEKEIYRLSKDLELLEFMYKYKDKINYVIFKTKFYVEIISLTVIPELIQNQEAVVFEPLKGGEISIEITETIKPIKLERIGY